ncbi:MAG TPA: nuclear transport factor 2 family protein [Candidatus Angelobacter sp.]|nr:nuclear transport factor 2 family protein [Candidatus Angelobacter sp.]
MGTSKHATWNTATGGEQYERLMWKAIHDKDWDNVERHLSPTFIGVNAEGQMLDRPAWIAYWKSVLPAELLLGEINVQPEGADMKVSGILQLQGGRTAASLRVISIWQQVKTRWTLTATSLTPIQNK